MNYKKTILRLGTVLLGCLALDAQAAFITESHSAAFNFNSNALTLDRIPLPWTSGAGPLLRTTAAQKRTVSIARFDSSLGTLQGVDIWFDSLWSLTSTVHSFDIRTKAKTASARGKAISNQSVSLFIDPDKEVIRNHEVVRSNCWALDTCQDVVSDSGAFDGTLDLSAFTLADFIGMNSLDFTVRRFLAADLTKCGVKDLCWEKNSDNAWSGNIHVNYTYSVPEPSSLVLMSLGLLGLGASRQRRRCQQ